MWFTTFYANLCSLSSRILILVVALLWLTGCAGAAAVAQSDSATPIPSPAISVPASTTTPTSVPTAQPEPSPTADGALIALGIEVYRSQYCGICHTLAVANTRGTFGPVHDHVATNALDHLADPGYTGSATTVQEYLMESLLDPQAYASPGFELTPHAMPSFAHLDEADLRALVTLLAAQK